MKISFIATFMNEEKSIEKFIKSILNQSVKPDEIVLVDGFSKDKTYEIVKDMAKKNKKIKVFQKKCNIAEGRNFAVSKAMGDVILVADAGCIVDKNWIKELVKFYPEYDVVIGNWEAYGENIFEKCAAEVVQRKERMVTNPLGNASSRSLSFKKSIWKKAGGYPEDTYTGEDTKFNLRMKKAGGKFKFAEKAMVKWRMRPTWKKFARQFYMYGVGDGKTRNFVKMKPNLAMFIGFWGLIVLSPFYRLAGISLAGVLGLYGLYWGALCAKNYRSPSSFYWGFVNSITKRVAYVVGVLRGLFK